MSEELLLTDGMARMVEPYLLLKSGAWPSSTISAQRFSTHAKRAMRKALSEAQNHRCAGCGVRFSDDPESPQYATIEHFIGRGFGGPYVWDNLAVACETCNKKRQCPADSVIEVFG